MTQTSTSSNSNLPPLVSSWDIASVISCFVICHLLWPHHTSEVLQFLFPGVDDVQMLYKANSAGVRVEVGHIIS